MRTIAHIEHFALFAIWAILPLRAKGAIYRAHRTSVKRMQQKHTLATWQV